MASARARIVTIVLLSVVVGATGCASTRNREAASTPSSTTPGVITNTTIRANGFTFDARTAGPPKGPLVILLHGFPQSSYEWRKVMPTLGRAGYHVVAPDQRGYSPGARPIADAEYTIDNMVADTIAIAERFSARKFHLVGHDWGAGVAWATAIAHPDRLRSLTAVSVPHPAAYAKASENPNGEQSKKKGYIDTFIAPGVAAGLANEGFLRAAFGGTATDADINEYMKVLGTTEAMDAALAWYRANDLRTGLGTDAPSVKVPTLFVYGTADCCLGRDAADLTANYVAAPYRYEVLDGVTHWIPEAAKENLTELLVAFLAAPTR